MTATDELRLPNDTKKLDTLLNERGQEHRVWPSGMVVWHDEHTVYEYEPAKNHHSEYWGGILRMTMRHITPEQAIAATLGWEMLTADDVRDLIERHSDASGGNGRDFHNGAYVAIADELSAKLGSCNCSNDCTNSERMGTCHDKGNIERFICSECGCRLDLQDDDWEATMWLADGVAMVPRYCPNCGRKVVTDG